MRRGRGERVLLVDDEPLLLEATAEVLVRLGYEPVAFSDSQAALAAFEAAPARFDAVVTSEAMPVLTGTGLAKALHLRRPDLPIVLVSGYSGSLLTQQALASGARYAWRDAGALGAHSAIPLMTWLLGRSVPRR